MSAADETARTELIALLASYGEYVEVDTAIQHVRESWQRSQPIEVTENPQRDALASAAALWYTGTPPQLDDYNFADTVLAEVARAALGAVEPNTEEVQREDQ